MVKYIVLSIDTEKKEVTQDYVLDEMRKKAKEDEVRRIKNMSIQSIRKKALMKLLETHEKVKKGTFKCKSTTSKI